MSRVLVTGGNGRVGKRVTQRLVELGFSVRVVDVTSGDDNNVEYVVGDISDYDLMSRATDDVKHVVHLAAIPVENGQSRELFTANVEGTFNVIDCAAKNGARGFVFASTVGVYGFLHPSQPWTPQYFPVDEDAPLIAERNYANMKIIGEQFQQAYVRSHEMDCVALRLATVVNPSIDPWLRVISTIDDPETPFLRGLTLRDYLWQYVHVDDAARALATAVQHTDSNPGFGFEAFNIGAADNLSTVPTLELISTYFPQTAALKSPSRFVAEPLTALYGIDKARRILNFEPALTWRDG